MTEYRLVAEPQVDLDVVGAVDWYENGQSGLGFEFLDELRATYDRILEGPLKYHDLRSGIRRALLRRFPYACTLRSKGGRSWCLPSFTQAAIPQNGSDAHIALEDVASEKSGLT